MNVGQGNRNKRDVRWYLDDDDGGRELADPESLPRRYRRLVWRTIRIYWLTLLNVFGVVFVVASGTVFSRRDYEALAIIATGLILLASVAVLVVGYAFNSKQVVYTFWEQAGFLLAHLTALGLGAIVAISLLA